MSFNLGYVSSEVKNTIEQERYLQKFKCVKISSIFDIKKYKINLVFVLGGDGFMLRVLHKFIHSKVDFYGINCGTHGFLLNDFTNIQNRSIEEVLNNVKKYTIFPLKSIIENNNGKINKIYAINEISLLRNTHNAVHIKIVINNRERLGQLISDGIIVSSPAGSTAYNLSLNGPILPLDSNLLSITPISPFRPRLWKGAIVNNESNIEFEILDSLTRSVNVTADFKEYKNIKKVKVFVDLKEKINLLFNRDENMEEKIANQQFYS